MATDMKHLQHGNMKLTAMRMMMMMLVLVMVMIMTMLTTNDCQKRSSHNDGDDVIEDNDDDIQKITRQISD